MLIAGTGDGAWYVFEVLSRVVAYRSLDDAREEIEATLTPHLPEMRLVPVLRQKAEIEIDWGAF